MIAFPKQLLGAVLGVMCACAVVPSFADTGYPNKPVRIVVPFAAGGGTDVLARQIGQRLGEALKTGIVIDNRPGAGGTIGSQSVARSAPDGYTLLLASISTHAISPNLYAKPPYDPVADFAPILRIGATPFIMTVHPDVPAQNLRELIALARANPGKLSFASSGNGTTSHLCGALFTTMAGVQMSHVPYKSNAPGLTDLLGGRVTFMFDNIIAMQPHIRSGKLRALAVTGTTRSGSMPSVPTMAEAGLPHYEVIGWFGMWAPAGTPRDIVERINTEVGRILKLPEVRARAEEQGVDANITATPEEFGAYVQAELVKWKKIVQDAGAQVD